VAPYGKGGHRETDNAAPNVCIKVFKKNFKKVPQLLQQFASTYATLNFKELCQWLNFSTSTAALHVVAGCWCQYAHAIIKRTNKIGLKKTYGSDSDLQNVVHCLVSLPLLSALIRSPYSRVSTAAAAARTTTKPVRRPCQQWRRQHQKFDFVFLLNSSYASTFMSYASASTMGTFSVFFVIWRCLADIFVTEHLTFTAE